LQITLWFIKISLVDTTEISDAAGEREMALKCGSLPRDAGDLAGLQYSWVRGTWGYKIIRWSNSSHALNELKCGKSNNENWKSSKNVYSMGIGKMRNCRMRKVKCGMQKCGYICGMRNL